MNLKKLAVTTTMTGALGLSALGLGAGLAHASAETASDSCPGHS